MDLKKIPPSMLVVLGLGATEACVQPCLGPPNETSDPAIETSSTGNSGGDSTGVDTRPGTEVGPCLSIGEESTTSGSSSDSGTTGGSGSDSGTTGGSGGSDSGTTAGSGSEGGSTVGPCLAPPGIIDEGESLARGPATPGTVPAASRKAALARLLERNALPADIAARLRDDIEE